MIEDAEKRENNGTDRDREERLGVRVREREREDGTGQRIQDCRIYKYMYGRIDPCHTFGSEKTV